MSRAFPGDTFRGSRPRAAAGQSRHGIHRLEHLEAPSPQAQHTGFAERLVDTCLITGLRERPLVQEACTPRSGGGGTPSGTSTARASRPAGRRAPRRAIPPVRSSPPRCLQTALAQRFRGLRPIFLSASLDSSQAACRSRRPPNQVLVISRVWLVVASRTGPRGGKTYEASAHPHGLRAAR